MASLLVRQISRYISGLPAARRDISRKPLAASREASLQAGPFVIVSTRAIEATKGRWLTLATWPSCSAGSRKRTRAPSNSTKEETLLIAVERVRGVGVRQYIRLRNREASAASTPLTSLPVMGCPPTKETEVGKNSSAQLITCAFVLATSVTTAPGER